MTVIAWDGKTLAADRRAHSAGCTYSATKIHRVPDGIAAYSGELVFGEQMLAWYRNGAIPHEFPPSQRTSEDWSGLLVIRNNGQLLKYERTPYPMVIDARFYAMGSGRDFAAAAMHLGCDAAEAVRVASQLCCYCGNGVDTLVLEPDGNGPLLETDSGPNSVAVASVAELDGLDLERDFYGDLSKILSS